MALSPQQRTALLQTKLRTLIVEHWNVDASTLVATSFPAGAGFVAPTTGVGWVLVAEVEVDADPMDTDHPGAKLPDGWLGGSIVWRTRQRLTTLNVIADRASGESARRNALLTAPLSLFSLNGRAVVPMEPTPFIPVPDPAADVMAFTPTITASGADAVVEHGVLRAEVLGLEVGRVIVDAPEALADSVAPKPRLAIGVGKHDRLAQSMMYGDTLDVSIGLREAVESVRSHRAPDRGSHPANQLCRERWMRDVVCAQPSLVGCASLKPVASTVVPTLKLPTPAVAVGATAEGVDVVLGCSVGVGLDAALVIADTANVLGASAARVLRLVVPEGDDIPAVRLVAGAVREPVEVLTLPANWAIHTPVVTD